MKKRLLDKKVLVSIITNVVAIIIFVVGCNIMKHTHITAQTDIKMAIIFYISLLVSSILYLWIILMSVKILEQIDTNRKNR